MNLALVLNPDAGTLRGLDPQAASSELGDIFRARGHAVRAEIHAGEAAIEAIRRICASGDYEGVVVGGGDGTVSAAAAAAATHGVALGVLPLGTMNLFARSLGLPLEMRAAAQALAAGRRLSVDIGEANGALFIHHLTLGLHPRLIRIRERMRYGSRIGKIVANIQALLTVIRRPPRLRVRLEVDGDTIERRTSAIVISNNPFGEGHIPYADDLRQGRLGLYLSVSRGFTDHMRLAAALLRGDIRRSAQLEDRTAREVVIHLPRPVIAASIDGEIVSMESPLRVRILQRGLDVIQPVEEPAGLRAGTAAPGRR